MSKLSKFEKSRLLSARTLQVSENAPIYVKANKETSSYKLAKKEFVEDKLPLEIVKKTIKEDAEFRNSEVD